MITRIVLLFSFLLLISSIPLARAVTYYVDATGGNNSNNGCCDPSAGYSDCQGCAGANGPWQNISKVNSGTFSPGDYILFKRGEIWREKLTVPSSGSAGNPITFGAYGNGDKPQISGSTLITPGSSWSANTSLLGNKIVLNETFNAKSGNIIAHYGTGYVDATGWTGISLGDGSVMDADSTGISDPYGGSSHLLKIQKVSPNFNSLIRQRVTAQDISYTHFYYNFMGVSLTNNNGIYMAYTQDASYNYVWRIHIRQVNGVLSFRLQYYNDGTEAYSTWSSVPQPNTWYRIEVKWDLTNSAWAWRINGEPIANGSLTGSLRGAPRDWLFGDQSNNFEITSYYDNIYVSTDTWQVPNVWQASLTTKPNQVFFDGIRGTNVATNDLINNNSKWSWASNRLYVYSTTDPDTAYTNPGIEGSTRNNCVGINSKNYITLTGLWLEQANADGLLIGTAPNTVIVDGCTVSKAYDQGISPGGESQNVTIQNCTVNWCGGSGINVDTPSHNWTIKNNIIHNNAQVALEDNGIHQFSAGIKGWDKSDDVSYIVIEGNEVYSQGQLPDNSQVTSYQANAMGIWLDTFAFSSYTGAPVINRNKVYDNFYTGILIENGAYYTVSYNLVYNNRDPSDSPDSWGIRVSDWGNNSPANYNKILNNVVYDNDNGIQISGSRGSEANRAIGNLVQNNIVTGNTGYDLSAEYGGENDGTMGSGNVYTYNCFGAEASNFIEWGNDVYKSTYDAWETAAGNCGSNGCSNSVESDPLFTNPAAHDFHLQSSSPAINAGTNVGLTRDYEGTAVPQGPAPDIGAYEYTSATQCIHRADTNCDGCVSSAELTAFINLWYVDSSNPTLKELIETIGLWKRGC